MQVTQINKSKLIELFWQDLTPEAQERVRQELPLGEEPPEAYNWEVFPLAEIIVGEEPCNE